MLIFKSFFSFSSIKMKLEDMVVTDKEGNVLDPKTLKEMVTRDDIAAEQGIHYMTVQHWMKKGLPYEQYSVKGRWRVLVKRSDLEIFLRSGRIKRRKRRFYSLAELSDEELEDIRLDYEKTGNPRKSMVSIAKEHNTTIFTINKLVRVYGWDPRSQMTYITRDKLLQRVNLPKEIPEGTIKNVFGYTVKLALEETYGKNEKLPPSYVIPKFYRILRRCIGERMVKCGDIADEIGITREAFNHHIWNKHLRTMMAFYTYYTSRDESNRFIKRYKGRGWRR